MMAATTTAQTVQPQQAVTVQLHPANTLTSSLNLPQYKKILFGLGITEFLVGLLCSFLGIIGLSVAFDKRIAEYNYTQTNLYIGQGLWCGVWVTIAGLLGILSGRKRASPHMIKAHMALSIVSAIFSAFMFSLAIPFALVHWNEGYISVLLSNIEITLAVFGFSAFILCIVSASYSCYAMSASGFDPCCRDCMCCECCTPQHQAQGQAYYIVQPTNPNQQLVQVPVRSFPGGSQYPNTSMAVQISPQQNPNPMQHPKQIEAQSAALTQEGATHLELPPSYSN